MRAAWFLARKVMDLSNQSFTRTILRIAMVALIICVTVMILARGMVVGFKDEISNKVFGFWGHVHISANVMNNELLFADPISRNPELVERINNMDYGTFLAKGTNWLGQKTEWEEQRTEGAFTHVQEVAIKPGIIKTKEAIEGIIAKGIGPDFNEANFQNYLLEGRFITFPDSGESREIIISQQTSQRLNLSVEDRMVIYFVNDGQQLPRAFTVVGIYRTGLEEYDKKTALVDLKMVQDLWGWSADQIGGYELFVEHLGDIDVLTEYLYDQQLPVKLAAQSIRQRQPIIFDWLELQDINERVILGLMLLVGIINMITALLILILERTRTIGVLKALGYSNWKIQQVFLIYGGYIIIVGLFWGNALGLFLAFLQKRFELLKLNEADYYVSTVPIALDFGAIAVLNLVLLVLILAFLVVPSFLISKIDPVRAISFD